MNTQPIEKQIHSSHVLSVQGLPWLTIQGEGPYGGRRAVFVRLGGCQLRCEMCDTDYTSNRQDWEPGELVKAISEIGKKDMVVITGGEPYRQPLGTFVDLLLHQQRLVQIETNGGLFQVLNYRHGGLCVVCSPKTGGIDERLLPFIRAWKYVVQHGKTNDRGLPTSTLGRENPVYLPPVDHPAPIYVQPLDEGDVEKNALNLKTAVQCVLEHDYTLCLQMHKLAGLP